MKNNSRTKAGVEMWTYSSWKAEQARLQANASGDGPRNYKVTKGLKKTKRHMIDDHNAFVTSDNKKPPIALKKTTIGGSTAKTAPVKSENNKQIETREAEEVVSQTTTKRHMIDDHNAFVASDNKKPPIALKKTTIGRSTVTTAPVKFENNKQIETREAEEVVSQTTKNAKSSIREEVVVNTRNAPIASRKKPVGSSTVKIVPVKTKNKIQIETRESEKDSQKSAPTDNTKSSIREEVESANKVLAAAAAVASSEKGPTITVLLGATTVPSLSLSPESQSQGSATHSSSTSSSLVSSVSSLASSLASALTLSSCSCSPQPSTRGIDAVCCVDAICAGTGFDCTEDDGSTLSHIE